MCVIAASHVEKCVGEVWHVVFLFFSLYWCLKKNLMRKNNIACCRTYLDNVMHWAKIGIRDILRFHNLKDNIKMQRNQCNILYDGENFKDVLQISTAIQ